MIKNEKYPNKFEEINRNAILSGQYYKDFVRKAEKIRKIQ